MFYKFRIKILLSSLLPKENCYLYPHMLCLFVESRLEGWLSLPARNNTKKFGWVKKVIDTLEYEPFVFVLTPVIWLL